VVVRPRHADDGWSNRVNRRCVRVSFARSFFTAWPNTPRLVAPLRRLGRAVDRRWPARETASDGWIGDDAHQGRVSRHNPDRGGIVRALDVTTAGIEPRELVDAAVRHPAVDHVIWGGRIWSRWADFRPHPYTEADPHTSHVHIDVTARIGPVAQVARWNL
jgi:hypothetical protein